jgi:biotin carboxyl carrier protein
MATSEQRTANSEQKSAENEPVVAVPEVLTPPEYKEINYEGYSYKTLFTKKFENRKPYEIPDPHKLISFIPGTIMKVFVKERQKVKKGEKLVVLQAMKMNNIILAPFSGVIKKVNVKQGELVPKEHLLIEMK